MVVVLDATLNLCCETISGSDVINAHARVVNDSPLGNVVAFACLDF